MKLMAENIDIYPDTLLDVIHVVSDVVYKEDRNFDDNKRIRNILDDLDSFNMSIVIQNVDMIKYSMLLSIDHITVELLEKEEIEFKDIEFDDDELKTEYDRLLNQYKAFEGMLELPDLALQYLQPNSRLVDIRLSMSIKDFVYFVLSCSKYDELLDVVVLLSNFDELLENLVTLSLSIQDIIYVEDLFIRLKLDEENRRALLDSGNVTINIVSNEEYINHCMEENKADVKLSSLGTCSLVAYREISKDVPKQNIKIENFFDLINQEYMSLTLPVEYLELDEYVMNALDGYIYDWYLLFDKIKSYEGMEMESMLCCLGCYSNIFKMNTPIENYFKLLYENEASEVKDLMSMLEQKLLNQ